MENNKRKVFSVDREFRIEKGPSTKPEYIELRYYNLKNKYREVINLTCSELSYIFGSAVMACITDRIDSVITLQKIKMNHENDKSNDYRKVTTFFSNPPFHKKHMIKEYTIKLSMDNRSRLHILFSMKYGFTDDIDDSFKLYKTKPVDTEFILTTAQSLELADFALNGNINIHSM